jgi:hypothetical protein
MSMVLKLITPAIKMPNFARRLAAMPLHTHNTLLWNSMTL